MAQRVAVMLEDDLDGSDADETIEFGIDGVSYEVDLSKKNAKALREAMRVYTEAGRRVPRRRAPSKRNVRSDTRQIREWAVAQGYEVSERGRIPAAVREAYDAAV